MINPIFDDKFVINYFEAFFKSDKRFPQSIVFEGFDTLKQYFFACELFRILNCKNEGNIGCDCANCVQIKESRHPYCINVTPIDFKEDSSKTVISVKQAQKITSLIREKSDKHRFFIFSNAKTILNESETDHLKPYQAKGYKLQNEQWFPAPLNRKMFQDEAANALLKSIEEAPDNTTFIFLTGSKDDLINTIVSRSLVFRLSSSLKQKFINVSAYLAHYPLMSAEFALESAASLSESENDPIQILDSIQNYVLNLSKEGKIPYDTAFCDIKKIEEAKKQIQASINPKYAFENLFIKLSKEGRNL